MRAIYLSIDILGLKLYETESEETVLTSSTIRIPGGVYLQQKKIDHSSQ